MDAHWLGRAAEELAAKEAARLKLQVLDRNWRTRLGEVDLVALDGDQLVIVEVKCRRTSVPQLGPALAVDGPKQRRLARLAHLYLQQKAASHGLVPSRLTVRFDVCTVVWAADEPQITWIKDAFRPKQ